MQTSARSFDGIAKMQQKWSRWMLHSSGNLCVTTEKAQIGQTMSLMTLLNGPGRNDRRRFYR